MNNSFDKYQYNNSFTQSNQFENHSYFIKDQVEHTFDQRNHHQRPAKKETGHHHDSRTQDQVMTNLNFSIEDLLSKISKATAQFQEPPKFTKPQSKSEYPAVFKLSNLSASTETTSNKQRSEPYIQRYQPHAQNTRKSEPHAQIGNNEKNNRNAFGQKQNSLYQTLPSPTNQMRNQLRSETYHHSKNTSQKYQDSKHNFDYIPEYKFQSTTYQWGRNSSRNQTQHQNVTEWGRNSSLKQDIQETQERFHQLKQNNDKFYNKWEINHHEVKNDAVHNYLHFEANHNEWDVKHSQNQDINNLHLNENKRSQQTKDYGYHTARTQNKIDEFENQWRKYQLKMNELKNNSKTQRLQDFSFKNIEKQDHDFGQMKIDLITPQRKEFTSQPQIQIINEHADKWSHSATTSPKKQIKSLFNQVQTSAFGHVHNANPIRSKQYKKSIILDDDRTPSSYQPVPVSEEKKVNSLFDGKRIREVAASTIIESPDKEKRLKMQNPFNEILKTNNDQNCNKIEQHAEIHYQHSYELLDDVPTIKINTVQKSENVHNMNFGHKMTIQDFHLGKQLGSGKFGDVYQAVHKATGSLFAIKKIFKSTILQYNMIEQFTRQLKIHYCLNYPNIIKLYTHFDDEYHVFLVMEYGQGGMLMEKIKNGEKFSSIIVEQMLRAVEYLHNKKIAHRDIKPQNIVLMFGDTAKLCDFGWSRVFDSDMKKTFCGTLDYVSPQMKDKGEYSLKIDVWSLGVLTFELLCGYAPFKDEITNWKKKGGNLNKAWNWNILYPPEISSVAESFMRNLLKQNPQQRANIRFCLNHLFIRKYNEMSFNQQQQKVFREVSMILKDD